MLDSLNIVQRSMDQMLCGSTDLTFPLFEPGELPELSARFSGHRASRAFEKENVYYMPPCKHTTVRIIDGDYSEVIC